jgi:2-dehydro-3-deoxyphosphogluconate aldolase/(4S)-4-hydroxy-2-oxoglutarate aldolase
MQKVFEDIGKIGIIPVVKIDDAGKALPLVHALVAGGIPCVEITFRTAAGEEAIRNISKDSPEVLLGAGTVLTSEQAERAVAAGAKFIVSPGFNPRVVSYCKNRGIPIIPGCSNPSDMELAIEFGLDTVKFFPAEQIGGLDYIKAVSAPYPQLKFIPTGGINQNNIARYICFEKVAACGGSWMVSADLINSDNFEKITTLCKEAVYSMLGFTFAHMAINTLNPETAQEIAAVFQKLFCFTVKDGNTSLFAGDCIEINKSEGLGKYGHIGVYTNSVAKAAAFFERQGITLDWNSAKKDANGKPTVVFLKEEIAGFAVHIVQRK